LLLPKFLLIVVLKTTNVLEVLLVFFFAERGELLRHWLVIGHIDVFKFVLEHLVIGICQERFNFCLLFITLDQVTSAKFFSMLLLEGSELVANGPLPEEFKVFLGLVECGCREFLSPPGCVVLFFGAPGVLRVRIVDDNLVIVAPAERPWACLVEAVVDGGNVRVRWIRVQRFSLRVEEEKLFVGVNRGNQSRRAHNAPFLGHSRLQALEVVCRKQLLVINVTMILRIVLD